MINTKKAQKEVYQNKVNHGFNLTDINMEFCLLNAEVGEAYMAWLKQKDDTGEELADVAIYLLGIAEILGIDLGKEIGANCEIPQIIDKRYLTDLVVISKKTL